MIDIKRAVTVSPEQIDIIIEGMRNPMNSWDKSDSDFMSGIIRLDNGICVQVNYDYILGESDKDLMLRLCNGGPVNAKFRRMIPCWVQVLAPLYWWKEFDTYRVGVVPNPADIDANSCSTMHTIMQKKFDISQFSTEHLVPLQIHKLEEKIEDLNELRNVWLHGGIYGDVNSLVTYKPKDKDIWWQIIQTLPESYNQQRLVYLNYEALHNMHYWRHNHKQDEWRIFCKWEETLPYSFLITSKDCSA